MDHIRPTQGNKSTTTPLHSATHTRTATVNHSSAAATRVTPVMTPTLPCDDEEINAHYFRHADLLLLKYDQQLYLDVAVVRPTKASSLNTGVAVQSVPLYSTHAVEAMKTRKYAAITEKNQYTFFPFVVETYGGIGRKAERLLRILSAHSIDRSPVEFMTDAYNRIAVSLQKSNANLALNGQQRMISKRRAVQPVGWQCRRVSRYSYPQDTSLLQEQLAPQLAAADAAVRDALADAINPPSGYEHIALSAEEPVVMDESSEHESFDDLSPQLDSSHSTHPSHSFLSPTTLTQPTPTTHTHTLTLTHAQLTSPHSHSHTPATREE
jgi:hypothetical protein